MWHREAGPWVEGMSGWFLQGRLHPLSTFCPLHCALRGFHCGSRYLETMLHSPRVEGTRDPWLSHLFMPSCPYCPELHFLTSFQMEKEEETTRELLLPNWQGSGSHGLTIAQRDNGVFVQEVMQNSPAARTGVVKEGESPQGEGWVLGWGGRGWWREGQGAGRSGQVAVEGPVLAASGWSGPTPCPPLPTLCLLVVVLGRGSHVGWWRCSP